MNRCGKMERKKKKLDRVAVGHRSVSPAGFGNKELDRLFNKRFAYSKHKTWTLSGTSLFKADCCHQSREDKYSVQKCHSVGLDVNEVQEQFSGHDCDFSESKIITDLPIEESSAKDHNATFTQEKSQGTSVGVNSSPFESCTSCHGDTVAGGLHGSEEVASRFVLPGPWQCEHLMQMKEDLNQLKDRLSDKEMVTWHQHTSSTNPAGKVVSELKHHYHVELCTQAWCKFHEILSTCDVLPASLWDQTPSDLFSVHLCEAPGAFITSLNHFLVARGYRGRWSWLGTTLNPYYEGNDTGQMIDDDRFIRTTYKNWFFGVDNSGDLMSEGNLECLLNRVKPSGGVNLVTADGSIDCQENPAEQEILVSRLHHCEVLTACLLLAPGGALVIKLFTMLEASSIGLMYFLTCCFDKVTVCKPATSKSGNSEVYVVCAGYTAPLSERKLLAIFSAVVASEQPDIVLMERSEIPDSFLQKHIESCEYFCRLQSDTISQNIALYQQIGEEEQKRLSQRQDLCVDYYVRICSLQKIENRNRIVPFGHKTNFSRFSNVRPKGNKGYYERTTADASNSRLADSTGGTWVLPPGRFQGTFRERQQQHRLSWLQLLALVPDYIVDDGCISIQCRQGLREDDNAECRPLMGGPLHHLASSQFCNVRSLADMKQLLHNSQLQRHQQAALADYARSVLSQAANLLLGNHLCSHHFNTAAFTKVFHLALQGSVTSSAQAEAQDVSWGSLQSLDSLSTLGNHHQPVGVVLDVTWPQWMETEELHCQRRLLDVLLDICSYVPEGSSVAMLTPVPLTRLSAGLMYVMASIFRETNVCSRSDSVFLHQLYFSQYLQVPSYSLLSWLESLRRTMAAAGSTANTPQGSPVKKACSVDFAQSVDAMPGSGRVANTPQTSPAVRECSMKMGQSERETDDVKEKSMSIDDRPQFSSAPDSAEFAVCEKGCVAIEVKGEKSEAWCCVSRHSCIKECETHGSQQASPDRDGGRHVADVAHSGPLVHGTPGTVYSTTHTVHRTGACMHSGAKRPCCCPKVQDKGLGDHVTADCVCSEAMEVGDNGGNGACQSIHTQQCSNSSATDVVCDTANQDFNPLVHAASGCLYKGVKILNSPGRHAQKGVTDGGPVDQSGHTCHGRRSKQNCSAIKGAEDICHVCCSVDKNPQSRATTKPCDISSTIRTHTSGSVADNDSKGNKTDVNVMSVSSSDSNSDSALETHSEFQTQKSIDNLTSVPETKGSPVVCSHRSGAVSFSSPTKQRALENQTSKSFDSCTSVHAGKNTAAVYSHKNEAVSSVSVSSPTRMLANCRTAGCCVNVKYGEADGGDGGSGDCGRRVERGVGGGTRQKLSVKVPLEAVPVLQILNDMVFTRFLQASNKNCVGSFVNNVKAAEQTLLCTENAE